MIRDERADSLLLAAAAAGDDAAFGVLVRRHIRTATLLATQLVGDADDADDVVQEAFTVVHRQARRFEADQPFPPWLYGIVRRLASNRRMRGHRRNRLLRLWASAAPQPVPAASVESVLLARMEQERVMQRLQMLSPMQRACFELVALRDLPTAEVAAMHGIQESTVRQHLFRARAVLREELNG